MVSIHMQNILSALLIVLAGKNCPRSKKLPVIFDERVASNGTTVFARSKHCKSLEEMYSEKLFLCTNNYFGKTSTLPLRFIANGFEQC